MIGALSIGAASSNDTALDLDGILPIDVVGPATADFVRGPVGTIEVDSTRSIFGGNGETDLTQIDW
jgi:hypothetical protein